MNAFATYVSENIRVAPLGAIVTQPASSPGNSSAVGKPYFPLLTVRPRLAYNSEVFADKIVRNTSSRFRFSQNTCFMARSVDFTNCMVVLSILSTSSCQGLPSAQASNQHQFHGQLGRRCCRAQASPQQQPGSPHWQEHLGSRDQPKCC